LETLSFFSRDNARTPMQWSGDAHAGFTTGDPWLMENANFPRINVKEQQSREDSVLSYYKKLIRLRKDPAYKETLVYGDFVPVEDCAHNVIAYYRKTDAQTILVAANFGKDSVRIALPAPEGGALCSAKTLLTNGEDADIEDGALCLRGQQAVVMLLGKD
jgi:oligo-1,6-glucosidase